jgi:hypothetical protein
MAALATRIKRLEEATGGGGWDGPPCDHCGWGGWGGEPDDRDEGDSYEIAFADPDEDLGPEFCPECSRRLVHEIWFDDDARAPWNQVRAAEPL